MLFVPPDFGTTMFSSRPHLQHELPLVSYLIESSIQVSDIWMTSGVVIYGSKQPLPFQKSYVALFVPPGIWRNERKEEGIQDGICVPPHTPVLRSLLRHWSRDIIQQWTVQKISLYLWIYCVCCSNVLTFVVFVAVLRWTESTWSLMSQLSCRWLEYGITARLHRGESKTLR